MEASEIHQENKNMKMVNRNAGYENDKNEMNGKMEMVIWNTEKMGEMRNEG